MEVERSSVGSNNGPQPKPSNRVSDDLAYSMKRWLEEQPHEEPYRGPKLDVTQISGYGESPTNLVVIHVTCWH